MEQSIRFIAIIAFLGYFNAIRNNMLEISKSSIVK